MVPTISSAEAAERAAIARLVERATALQDDADGLPDLHTDDAVIVNVAGRRIAGREAFRDAMTAALDSPLAQVRTTVEITDIRFVTHGAAIVSCTKTIQDARPSRDGADALPAEGAMSYVVTRVTGDWQIALAQTTPRR